MTNGEAREMARGLVRGSIIEDAASQFIALVLKETHDSRIKPLRAEVEALAAKLAEVEAERDAFASNIPDAAQNLIRNAHTGRLKALHRAVVAEAELAHLENHIEATAKDTHSTMLQYEAALPAVYRLALADAGLTCEQLAEIELTLIVSNPPYEEGYSDAASICFENIRALPTPTAAELMARINEGEKK